MLPNDCETRWGSTYTMLKRFIEQQQAICAVFLEDRGARQFMPSDDELSTAEELVEVFKDNQWREVPHSWNGFSPPTQVTFAHIG